MSSPPPAPAARITRLRRIAARLSRRRTPPTPPPPVATPAAAPTAAPPPTSAPAAAPAASPPAPAGTTAPTPASPSTGSWWTRLERSLALLVSVSTLAAGAALVTVRQASGEQRLTRDGQVTDRYNAAVTFPVKSVCSDLGFASCVGARAR
jgi:hypothetical protein